MEDLLERMAMMKAGYDPARVQAYRQAMAGVYASHPNRWVVYDVRWDEEGRACEIAVLADFATHGEAVRWSMSQPRTPGMAVMSTRSPEPGVIRL